MIKLKNIDVRKKLILMLLLPTLGFIALSTNTISKNISNYYKLTEVELGSRLSVQNMRLIGRMQVERGISYIFANNETADNKAELTKIRNSLDKMLMHVDMENLRRQIINSEKPTIIHAANFIYSTQEKLKQLRQTIDSKALPSNKILDEYNALIDLNLSLNKQMSSLSADKRLNTLLNISYNISKLQNATGLQRALASTLLEKKINDMSILQALMMAIGNQNIFNDTVLNEAPPAISDKLQIIQASKDSLLIASITQKLLSNTKSQSNSMAFFKAISSKILMLQDLNLVLMKQIQDRNSQLQTSTLMSLVTSVIAMIIALIISFALIYAISQQITQSLARLKMAANEIINGHTSVTLDTNGNDEFGALNKDFKAMLKRLTEITKIASNISKGSFSNEIKPLNERDVLGSALVTMISKLRNINAVANSVAKGDFTQVLQVESEKDLISNSLNSMTKTLKETSEKDQNEMWVKNGIGELNVLMQGDLDTERLATDVITYIAKYTNAKLGIIYLCNESNELELVASYAHMKRKHIMNNITPGEGLVGQAFLEKEMIILTDVPADYISISSGLGEKTPKNIVVLPLVLNEQVVGVIELGSFEVFQELMVEFLKNTTSQIAIAINSSQNRVKMRDLLERSQRQSEELEQQQEELQASNLELEQQADKLKESEEELRQSNIELEEKTRNLEEQKKDIEDKNAEIEESREALEKKADELQVTSRYKSEFLANMSHELRTPLNSLMLLSKGLLKNSDDNLSEDQLEDVTVICNAGESLLTLINDILDLSKVEAGKLELVLEDLHIQKLLSNIKNQFLPIATSKNIDLTLGTQLAEDFTVKTDGLRIEQVLRNLLSNAIKFTTAGAVSLNVKLLNQQEQPENMRSQGQDVIAFIVEDTGVGIPFDKQNQVFNAFEQVDGSTARQFGGTGLGLTISQELIGLLNGEIKLLKSEPGKGSVFAAYIPVSTDLKTNVVVRTASVNQPRTFESPAPQSTRQPSPPAVTKAIPKASPVVDDRENINPQDNTVLIIEDDITFAKHLLELAHQKAFKAIVAHSGETGLQFARSYQPKAIILDLGLPDIDGDDVIDRLLLDDAINHIPVHIITGRENKAHYKQKGIVDFLQKPVNENQLLSLYDFISKAGDIKIKHILVIEDDSNCQHAIKSCINIPGVAIMSIDTGQGALTQLRSNTFDCIILDYNLPDMNACALLREASQLYQDNLPPIIIYTGHQLTKEEYVQLQEFTSSFIVKGDATPERLLDEVTVFLGDVKTTTPAPAQPNTPKPTPASTNANPSPTSLTSDPLLCSSVMLVDDDVRNSFALSKQLKREGVNVIVADSGELALQKLNEEKHVDLILMDIMMPEMDGYEVMRHIRLKEEWHSIPIIALTAKAMSNDRQLCIDAGANDYMAKPIDADQLFDLMRTWVKK